MNLKLRPDSDFFRRNPCCLPLTKFFTLRIFLGRLWPPQYRSKSFSVYWPWALLTSLRIWKVLWSLFKLCFFPAKLYYDFLYMKQKTILILCKCIIIAPMYNTVGYYITCLYIFKTCSKTIWTMYVLCKDCGLYSSCFLCTVFYLFVYLSTFSQILKALFTNYFLVTIKKHM